MSTVVWNSKNDWKELKKTENKSECQNTELNQNWTELNQNWTELEQWIELNWNSELNWIGTELNQNGTELGHNWTELDWTELGQIWIELKLKID
mgnify:CR=1 FL=1